MNSFLAVRFDYLKNNGEFKHWSYKSPSDEKLLAMTLLSIFGKGVRYDSNTTALRTVIKWFILDYESGVSNEESSKIFYLPNGKLNVSFAQVFNKELLDESR